MHAHARVHAARPWIFFHEKVKSAQNTKILPPEKYPLYGTHSRSVRTALQTYIWRPLCRLLQARLVVTTFATMVRHMLSYSCRICITAFPTKMFKGSVIFEHNFDFHLKMYKKNFRVDRHTACIWTPFSIPVSAHMQSTLFLNSWWSKFECMGVYRRMA
jgi:hypothetical protein